MAKYSFHEMTERFKDGTLEEIEGILKETGLEAVLNREGFTPMHLASNRNRADVTQWLVNMGCSVNVLNKDGKSPLYYCGCKEVAEILIGAGAVVNQPSVLGKMPLHHVCEFPAVSSVVDLLLHSGAQVDAEDKFGNTPLLNACSMAYGCKDKEEVDALLPKIDLLIEHGADVHRTNLTGESGLHISSLHCTHEITEILLSNGVNVNGLTKKIQTPLNMVCMHGSTAGPHGQEVLLATLTLLLKHGADPRIADTNGLTPLHGLMLNHWTAISARDIAPCVHVLVEHGASLNAVDNMLRTPAHYACYARARHDWLEMLELLNSLGANINAQDVEGFAPIHVIAPQSPKTWAFETMVCREEFEYINWNCARKHGITLAHIVLATKDLELLGCGVPGNIDAQDEFLSTPMHHAEFSRNLLRAKSYLWYAMTTKADMSIKNCLGETVLDCAASSLSQEMLPFLKSQGESLPTKKLEGLLPDSACEVCSQFAATGSFSKPFPNEEESLSIDPAELKINEVGNLEEYLPHILHTPRIGKVRETAEAEQIYHETEKLLTRILEKVGHQDDRFQSVLIPSGSVHEKTKVGLPDEFDFMCNLEQLSSCCEVVDSGSCAPGFVCFKGMSDSAPISEFLDANGYLLPYLVRSKLEDIIRSVMFDPELWQSCRICSNFVLPSSRQEVVHPKPSIVLNLSWNGPLYKNMHYTVDIVPVIDAGSFWPLGAVSSSPLLENVPKQCLFTMTIPQFDYLVYRNEVRISFSQMESAIFDTIPKVIKDAYITAKAVRELCPVLVDHEMVLPEEKQHTAASLIPSYWLKMALFHELAQHGQDDGCSLTVWVRRIFQRLCQYVLEDEAFPSFFMPQQDFIAEKLRGRDKSFPSLKRRERAFTACKKMCCMIQRFLQLLEPSQ